MPQKELTRLLHKVHDELEDTDRLSAEDQALLVDLMSDIRAQLGDDTNEEDQGLGERLNEAVQQFNQTHPTLAFTLRRMLDALAKMGI